MGFLAILDSLDAAVIDHLTDGEATLLPADGGPAATVHPIVEQLVEEDPLQSAKSSRPKPFLQLAVLEAPELHERDVLVIAATGARWQLVEEPTRINDGRWWQAAVTALPPVDR